MTKKANDIQAVGNQANQIGLPDTAELPEAALGVALNREAISLIERLPAEVRPLKLPEEYPRICNQIAELWTDQAQATPFFDDLLIDNRGDRNGFSLSIIMEISKLKEHLLSPAAMQDQDIWDLNRNFS